MPIPCSVSHVFRPVGQGLFAQGHVRLRPDGCTIVSWVHDCGATGNPAPLHREITRARNGLVYRRYIDVLILSHLDEDHVNGLATLLRDVRVGCIVLPYATPADRLLFAISRGSPVSPTYLRFLVEPTTYLRSLTEIAEVIYIDGPGDDGGEPEQIPLPGLDLPRTTFDRLEPWIEGDGEAMLRPKLSARGERRFRGRAGIICAGLWEFRFFNRRAWRGCIPKLQSEVRTLVAGFLAKPAAKQDYNDLLQELRRLYRDPKQFGDGENGRNEISLITYAGPVGLPYITKAGEYRYLATSQGRLAGLQSIDEWAPALLYTGDIVMRHALSAELQRQLTATRWDMLGLLQVPHHGADTAWREIPATNWRHRRSVFSYGLTNTYKHPGKVTQKALAGHGPRHVTEEHGFLWWYSGEWAGITRSDTAFVDDS